MKKTRKKKISKEVQKLLEEINTLKQENNFLLKSQREIKSHAESEINDLMPYKHKCIRLEERNKELINELELLRKVNKK